MQLSEGFFRGIYKGGKATAVAMDHTWISSTSNSTLRFVSRYRGDEKKT